MSLAAIIIMGAAACNRAPQLNSSNIDQVLKAMTLEEKADLVVGRYDMNGADSVSGCIIVTSEIARLGIPSITIASRDILEQDDTVRFPSALAMASTWDLDLIEKSAQTAQEQMRYVSLNWNSLKVI